MQILLIAILLQLFGINIGLWLIYKKEWIVINKAFADNVTISKLEYLPHLSKKVQFVDPVSNEQKVNEIFNIKK